MLTRIEIKTRIQSNEKIERFVRFFITSARNPRPRWYIRVVINRFVHRRARGSLIRRRSRIDLFPWKHFELGRSSTIEDFCTVNNGAGDIIIGDYVRIGIGSVIIGPVTMGNGSGLGQHVFVSGFNHGYSDGSRNSSDQELEIRPTIIEDEAHIGSNSVILPGIRIGKRCQVGAGSVVTRDVPSFSMVAGNPAQIIKQYNITSGHWERV